jgi:hypothetical protein
MAFENTSSSCPHCGGELTEGTVQNPAHEAQGRKPAPFIWRITGAGTHILKRNDEEVGHVWLSATGRGYQACWWTPLESAQFATLDQAEDWLEGKL